MWSIAYIINRIFDVILFPFRSLHPFIGLLVVSVLTGVLMLLIFGKTSNQRAIHWTKAKLKAHIAEIWLFRDDLLQMLGASAKVLAYTGRYLAHSLRPLLFIFVPVLIVMAMLAVRYEHRPFQPGEMSLIAVTVADPAWTRGDEVQLRGSAGVEVVGPALRIPAHSEIDWQIRATQAGNHEITVVTPRGETVKKIAVADGRSPLTALAPSRGRAGSGLFLEFPAEPPLAASTGLRSIEARDWPRRDLRIFGLGLNWLVGFFVLSLIAGFSVKDLLGVEV